MFRGVQLYRAGPPRLAGFRWISKDELAKIFCRATNFFDRFTNFQEKDHMAPTKLYFSQGRKQILKCYP